MPAPRPLRQPAQILAIFGLVLLGMLALVGLVLDGGNLYLQRRTAQAAADAGALAGARKLLYVTSALAVSQVATDVTTYATANKFGPSPSVPCAYFVDTTGAAISGGAIINDGTIASCPSTTTAIPSTASGIHVRTHVAFNTYVAQVLRIFSLTADGDATAQVGILTTYDAGQAPLIVCGGGAGNTLRISGASRYTVTTASDHTITAPSTLPTYAVSGGSGTTPDQILLANGQLDATKDGYLYYLKGSSIGKNNSDCGADSSKFDGGAAPGQTLTTLPATITGSNGNNVAAISQAVTAPGGCQGGTDIMQTTAGAPGCVLLLPVANGVSSSNPPVLTVPAWGAFYVWCNKASTSGTGCQEFVGQFLANWPVPYGPTSNTWTYGGTGITVVHLTR
jgi:hypothetical protein